MPEAFSNWETWKYNLRPTQKIPIWIYGWLGKIYVLSLSVENKIVTLHEIRLFTFISNLRYNEWNTPYASSLKIYFMMLKISCF